ncbi:MAG: hypothetical protein [Namikivirus tsukuho]|uniref:DUF4234 domain-containing protein n=1 Tax=Bacteriophage sp. TaxID=38018 RepID=A0ABY5TW57_9VIRU|nr:MAG: hypothetical protein [Bacteriophage sp.]
MCEQQQQRERPVAGRTTADHHQQRGGTAGRQRQEESPGFLKVLIYSVFTSGIYFFYWLVKMLSGGYRTK